MDPGYDLSQFFYVLTERGNFPTGAPSAQFRSPISFCRTERDVHPVVGLLVWAAFEQPRLHVLRG